jgi:hypothetical protein
VPTGDDENPFASDEEGDSDHNVPARANMTNPKKKDAVNKKGSHANGTNSSRKRPVSDSEEEEGKDGPPKKVVKSNAAAGNARKRGPPPKIKPRKKKADSESDSD